MKEIDIPFAGGEAQQIDRKISPNGALKTLQNLRFDKDFRLKKRDAYTSIPFTKTDGSAITGRPSKMFAVNGELIVITSELTGYKYLYTYTPTSSKWNYLSRVPEITSGVSVPVMRETDDIIAHTGAASNNGYIAYFTHTQTSSLSAQSVFAYVYDAATNALVFEQSFRSGGVNIGSPRIFSLGDYIILMYLEVSTGNLIAWRFDTTTTTPTAFTNQTTLSTGGGYDAVGTNGEIFVAQVNAGFTDIVLSRYNTSFALQSTINVGEPGQYIGIGRVGADVYVAYSGAANDRFCVTDLTLSAVTGPATYQTPNLDAQKTIGELQTVGQAVIISGYRVGAPPGRHPTTVYRVDNTAALLSQYVHYGIRIVSRAFSRGGRNYVMVIGPVDSTLGQGSYWMMDTNADLMPTGSSILMRPVVKFAENKAELTGGDILNEVASVDSLSTDYIDQLNLVFGATTFQAATGGFANASIVGADAFFFRIGDTRNNSPSIAGSTAYVTGGWLSLYDGRRCYEGGFSFYPEFTTLTPAAGTGIGAGTYSYAIIYERIDLQGNIHRSAPYYTSSLAIGAATDIDVDIPTYNISTYYEPWDSSNPGVQNVAQIYRTTNGGTIYYKVTADPGEAIEIDPTLDFCPTYTDSKPDANISGNEILYTIGGIVPNTGPAGARLVTFHKNRVFFGPGDDGITISYSKEMQPGYGAAFSDDFNFSIIEGGLITGMVSLDDALIIFKKEKIFALYGSGPDDLGNGAYVGASLITSEAGCIESRSIATTKLGVFFQAQRGIYLLARGQSAALFISELIEDDLLLYPYITSAVVCPRENCVRFTAVDDQYTSTPNARIFVFDYRINQWAVERIQA